MHGIDSGDKSDSGSDAKIYTLYLVSPISEMDGALLDVPPSMSPLLPPTPTSYNSQAGVLVVTSSLLYSVKWYPLHSSS